MGLLQTQTLRPALTFLLRQSLAMLQMPQAELASWLLCEIEKNPLLEIDAFPPSLPLKDCIPAPPSLYEHLMMQIHERFSDPSERTKAVSLLHELDERGFVPGKTKDPVLTVLQSFDPPGIFARDLRECLMLQLDPSSLAYKVVDLFYKEFLGGKWSIIEKKIKLSNMKDIISTLSRLYFRPADLFKNELCQTAIADLTICKINKTWIIESNDRQLPKFHLRPDFLSIPCSSKEEKESMRNWISSAKWLLRSLKRRKSILLAIGACLVRKQAAFLENREPLQPLSIHSLSQHLHLHASTLSRALTDKYARTPLGIIPLRSLISASSGFVKRALQTLIAKEPTGRPLSDQEIAAALQQQGFALARRTVAKYRSQCKIAPAYRRKHFSSNSESSKFRPESRSNTRSGDLSGKSIAETGIKNVCSNAY